MKTKFKTALKFLPLFVFAAAIVLYVVGVRNISPEELAKYIPQNTFVAALIIILAGSIKGGTVFFPFIFIELVSSLIFPPVPAIIINILALSGAFSVSYLIGRFAGATAVNKLCAKFKRFDDFRKIIDRNRAISVTVSGLVGILPMDVVGMYFGATKVQYFKYLFFSLLGGMPDLILETLIGQEIKNVHSVWFYIFLAARLGTSIASVLIYRVIKKRRAQKKVEFSDSGDVEQMPEREKTNYKKIEENKAAPSPDGEAKSE